MASNTVGSLDYQSWSNSYQLRITSEQQSYNASTNTNTIHYKLELISGPHNQFNDYINYHVKVGSSEIVNSKVWCDKHYNWTYVLAEGTTNYTNSGGKSTITVNGYIEDAKSSNKWAPPALSVSVDIPINYKAVGRITFYDGGKWYKAIPWFYDGGKWYQVIPWFYDGSKWYKCN